MRPSGEIAVRIGGYRVPVPAAVRSALTGPELTLGVRPEDLALTCDDGGIGVTVELVEELGCDAFVHAAVEGRPGEPVMLVARADLKAPPANGSRVRLAPTAAALHWFDSASGTRLPG